MRIDPVTLVLDLGSLNLKDLKVTAGAGEVEVSIHAQVSGHLLHDAFQAHDPDNLPVYHDLHDIGL